ncbi:hypothetical protein E2C01_098876 [Portunus trituberculatus]|uniref:Uncharacterized protein n=1 Tax=Portunus trituberculatus TaxID=210409 RepID=A0A5B7K836_PORTR|nr:hypothetical protein [Portunus trituberculatus]
MYGVAQEHSNRGHKTYNDRGIKGADVMLPPRNQDGDTDVVVRSVHGAKIRLEQVVAFRVNTLGICWSSARHGSSRVQPDDNYFGNASTGPSLPPVFLRCLFS